MADSLVQGSGLRVIVDVIVDVGTVWSFILHLTSYLSLQTSALRQQTPIPIYLSSAPLGFRLP